MSVLERPELSGASVKSGTTREMRVRGRRRLERQLRRTTDYVPI